MDQSHIRNFCIIAHIDHGKSTLADRMIEMTHTLTKREMQEQVLDNMDLERERGITIKESNMLTNFLNIEAMAYQAAITDNCGIEPTRTEWLTRMKAAQ